MYAFAEYEGPLTEHSTRYAERLEGDSDLTTLHYLGEDAASELAIKLVTGRRVRTHHIERIIAIQRTYNKMICND